MERIQNVLDKNPRLKKYIIDGELAGKTWQQTMTLFRSSTADVAEELARDGRFWIFDLINPTELHEPWKFRNERLHELLYKLDDPQIRVLPNTRHDSFDDFCQAHNENLAKGCDGSILKATFGGYEFKRSSLWLKVKPIFEMDCKIVGFNEGKGKYVGTLGSIRVRVPIEDNKWSKEVTKVSGMDDADRDYIWKHRKSLIGKIIEVKYRAISEKAKLVEGRVHRLRLDKGEV